MGERAPYSRIYWSVRNDPRLLSIYSDDHHWATWCRLLLAADMSWPAPADLPASARRSSLTALEAAGIIELLPGGLFTFHGLDTERTRRSESGRNASAVRWQSERNASGMRSDTERNASRAEQSRDEITPPPSKGKREDGMNPRALGTNPRSMGTSPRQERERVKRDPTPIHEILRRAAAAADE